MRLAFVSFSLILWPQKMGMCGAVILSLSYLCIFQKLCKEAFTEEKIEHK